MENRSIIPQLTFGKAERLTGKKAIEYLFSKGTTLFEYPFKIFLLVELPSTISVNRVLVSVPKRLFKKAVDRNLIKRKIKEGYRKNKSIFNSVHTKYTIGIVYVAKTILPTEILDIKLISVLNKLLTKAK